MIEGRQSEVFNTLQIPSTQQAGDQQQNDQTNAEKATLENSAETEHV